MLASESTEPSRKRCRNEQQDERDEHEAAELSTSDDGEGENDKEAEASEEARVEAEEACEVSKYGIRSHEMVITQSLVSKNTGTMQYVLTHEVEFFRGQLEVTVVGIFPSKVAAVTASAFVRTQRGDLLNDMLTVADGVVDNRGNPGCEEGYLLKLSLNGEKQRLFLRKVPVFGEPSRAEIDHAKDKMKQALRAYVRGGAR